MFHVLILMNFAIFQNIEFLKNINFFTINIIINFHIRINIFYFRHILFHEEITVKYL